MIYDQDAEETDAYTPDGGVTWWSDDVRRHADPDLLSIDTRAIRISSRPPRSVPNAPERDPAVLTSELRLGLLIAATWFTAGFFAGILFSIVR